MTDPHDASAHPGPVPQTSPAHAAPPAAGYPAPQSPAYPPASGSPAVQGPYGVMPPSGRRFWGLLFLVCIPYAGVIVALIVALVQRSGARRSPFEIVRENARWAANWALSFALYEFVFLVGPTAAAVVTAEMSVDGKPAPWAFAPYLVLVAVGIYCLVTLIRGCVIADRVVHRPALAIPFFRS
ncbi:hypothetical protein [uncultured Microbacterium sp.]|uniref:hypothetical protein n=1 Tax=uncultured Microbacterium sp. TaxID=191216 RepID=UPI0028DC1E9A|nr:hypothetical protein [uncultured Microbacterium sp.]